jgi:hypothetical protein
MTHPIRRPALPASLSRLDPAGFAGDHAVDDAAPRSVLRAPVRSVQGVASVSAGRSASI